jgi:amidohydrolase
VMESLVTSRPAEPHADLKARVAAAIEAHRDEILELSHRIHANPEPAFEEYQAAAWVAEAIGRHGYAVEHPAGSLATAVRGRITGGAPGGDARIGVLAEYDALPGLGHGCGHNTMAASGVGAAIGLAAVRDAFAGEIVFLGTPAEERGSGKAIMLTDGLFDGLDAALLYHPCDRNHVDCAPLASEDVSIVFTGKQSHASSEPWEGRNALDAMIALFVSVGLWRQQLPPHCRVHGIIQEGGTAANIIPDRTKAWFMIRSADQAFYDDVMKPAFRRLCEAAAMAAGVEVEVEFSGYASTMKTNRVLADRWVANAAAYGIRDEGPDPTSGSTDMANVSWAVPAIHPDLAIVDEPTPGHSILFRDAAGMPRADRTVLMAATLVA